MCGVTVHNAQNRIADGLGRLVPDQWETKGSVAAVVRAAQDLALPGTRTWGGAV